MLYPKHEFIPARILYALQRPGSAAIGFRRLAEGSANANNWNWVTFRNISSLKFWGIPKNRGSYDIWKGDFLYKFDVFNGHLVVAIFPTNSNKNPPSDWLSDQLEAGIPNASCEQALVIYIDVENGPSAWGTPNKSRKSMEF